jgi:hypothetical protein
MVKDNEMEDMRYYEVDVPVTLTVFVRGRGLTPEQAMQQAARYAESTVPSENEAQGYSSVAFEGDADGLAVTRTDLEITGAVTAVDTTDDQTEA